MSRVSKVRTDEPAAVHPGAAEVLRAAKVLAGERAVAAVAGMAGHAAEIMAPAGHSMKTAGESTGMTAKSTGVPAAMKAAAHVPATHVATAAVTTAAVTTAAMSTAAMSTTAAVSERGSRQTQHQRGTPHPSQ
jgi:hypothetical protein